MPKVCCVCQRVEVSGAWMIRDLAQEAMPTHGYCPLCAAAARVELANFRRRKEQRKQVPVEAH